MPKISSFNRGRISSKHEDEQRLQQLADDYARGNKTAFLRRAAFSFEDHVEKIYNLQAENKRLLTVIDNLNAGRQ